MHFLRFAVSPIETEFLGLPFILSSAPQIVTMVLREVAQYVHCHGIKFHFHLNDWLICHRDPAILVKHLKFVFGLAIHLGWLVNLKKLDLVPSQQFIYLGLDFDMQLALVLPSLECEERLETSIRLFF